MTFDAHSRGTVDRLGSVQGKWDEEAGRRLWAGRVRVTVAVAKAITVESTLHLIIQFGIRLGWCTRGVVVVVGGLNEHWIRLLLVRFNLVSSSRARSRPSTTFTATNMCRGCTCSCIAAKGKKKKQWEKLCSFSLFQARVVSNDQPFPWRPPPNRSWFSKFVLTNKHTTNQQTVSPNNDQTLCARECEFIVFVCFKLIIIIKWFQWSSSWLVSLKRTNWVFTPSLAQPAQSWWQYILLHGFHKAQANARTCYRNSPWCSVKLEPKFVSSNPPTNQQVQWILAIRLFTKFVLKKRSLECLLNRDKVKEKSMKAWTEENPQTMSNIRK